MAQTRESPRPKRRGPVEAMMARSRSCLPLSDLRAPKGAAPLKLHDVEENCCALPQSPRPKRRGPVEASVRSSG